MKNGKEQLKKNRNLIRIRFNLVKSVWYANEITFIYCTITDIDLV